MYFSDTEYRNPPSVGGQSYMSDSTYTSMLSPGSTFDAIDETNTAGTPSKVINSRRQRKLSSSKGVKRLQPYSTQTPTSRTRRIVAAPRDAQKIFYENSGEFCNNYVMLIF